MHVEPHSLENFIWPPSARPPSFLVCLSWRGSTVRGGGLSVSEIMTGKPSPAPWVVLEPYTNRSVYPIAIKLPVPDENAFWIIGEFNSQGGTPEQCRANADLAASAPLMLAALAACKAAAENAALPPSARLELVRDFATPAILAARGPA